LGVWLWFFLILLVPVTTATQIQTVKRDFSTTFVTYEKFKTMDAAELIVFIQHLAKENPQLLFEFQRAVEEITSTPVSSQALKDGSTFLGKKIRSSNKMIIKPFLKKSFEGSSTIASSECI